MGAQHANDAPRAERIRQVAADYLRLRKAGEPVGVDDFLHAHPDLMPELKRALVDVEGQGSTPRHPSHILAVPEGNAPEHGSPAAELFPGYDMVREIGRGGQGIVYEVVQRSTRRKVAIKVAFHGHATANSDRRFEREVHLAASLRHPSIVTVFDSAVAADGRQFYVMDYVRGETLNRYVQTRYVSTAELVRLFQAVCEAVGYAHSRGIVHRDLKPTNIIVDGEGLPRVLDFGLAKALGSAADVSTSLSRAVIGTVKYMSPEQARGQTAEMDPRSDVYSLGVILYELLTGTTPYETDTDLGEALRAIVEKSPISPRDAWRSQQRDDGQHGPPREKGCPIDRDLETILLTSLQKDRSRRYADATALARDLANYLAGRSIDARRDSPAYVFQTSVRGWARRHRMTALAVSAFLGAAVSLWPVGPVVVEWTPVQDKLENLLTTWLTNPAQQRIVKTRVVGFTDKTDFEAIARAESISGVNDARTKTFRGIHGRFMERLAQGRPRVVVWDFHFQGDTEWDEDFVRGVQAIKAVGADVVIGLSGRTAANERPNICATIQPHVRWGRVAGHFSDAGPWYIELMILPPGGDPSPSLALESMAAFGEPGAEVEYILHFADKAVEVRYKRPDPKDPRVKIPVGKREFIRLLGANLEISNDPDHSIMKGDALASFMFAMPPNAALQSATIEYADVFSATPAQLREWFEGKAVIVANLRGSAPDRVRHPDGRELAGAYGHAAALDALLTGKSIRLTLPRHNIVLSAVAAVLGLVAAWACGPRLVRRMKVLALLTSGLILCSVAAYGLGQLIYNPVLATAAMLVSCELATWLRAVAPKTANA